MASTITQPVSTPPPPAPLLTAEEFHRACGEDPRTELIDGIVVRNPMPGGGKHGRLANNLAFELTSYIRRHKLGQVCNNDVGVVTKRNPDRVRGADLAYISFATNAGEIQDGWLPVSPDLVAEVKSPSDRWPDVTDKANEYLAAGVKVVLVIDPPTRTLLAYRLHQPQQTFTTTDTLTVPDVLPGFAVPVAALFE